jgi:signal transduction histidine kinase
MNAHNLRSPVASILGLINLMDRLELEADQRVYLDHLKSSAESLDKVVRSITRRIEQGQGL